MNLNLLSVQAANIPHVSTRSKGPAAPLIDLSSQPPKKRLAMMARQEQENMSQEMSYRTCQATPKTKLSQKQPAETTTAPPPQPPLIPAAAIKTGNYLLVAVECKFKWFDSCLESHNFNHYIISQQNQ